MALEAAIDECGVDGVEFDVHLTADDVLILQHDESLDRMTTGSGLIASQPWKGCLDQLETKHEAFPGQPITTFATAIQSLLRKTTNCNKNNTKFSVIIDVKDDQSIAVLSVLCRDLNALLPTVHNLEIFVGVWCDAFAEEARRLSFPPGTHFTWIGEELTNERATCDLYDSFDVNIDLLEASAREEAQRLGKPVFVWTCNAAEQIAKAKQLAVTGILTDDPTLVN